MGRAERLLGATVNDPPPIIDSDNTVGSSENTTSKPSNTKSCIFLTAFAPVPGMAGSHMRAASEVLALSQDFDVHVICTDIRPEMVDLASVFCKQHSVTFTHDPGAFGMSKRLSIPVAVKIAVGCISPRLEALTVRQLPLRILRNLHSADSIWVYRQSTFRFRSVPLEFRDRVVVDLDDIEERVILHRTDYPRWFRWLLARKTRFSRQRLLESAQTVLLCSELDTLRLKTRVTKRVLPNTYPKRETSLPELHDSSHHAVMVGLMNYFPNKEGAQWFIDTVWDRVRHQVPDARLTIAGRGSDELFSPSSERNIHVVGQFDDPESILMKASVVVVPVRHGSGTRVKILEAFAFGCPVVSTTVGTEGLDVVDGDSILIADDPVQFARHVVSVFNDRQQALDLARSGQELFLTKYSPEVFSATVLEIARDTIRHAERIPR